MPSRILLIRILLATLVLSLPVEAQNSATTGAINGAVRNTTGEVVPNAMVTVRDLSTNQIRSTTTDAEGSYRLNSLAVSTYELRVKSPAFAEYVDPEVTLVLGRTTAIDITLQPEGVNAAVEVSGEPPLMDVSQMAVTTSVTQENVEELPVKDRNYLQFALVAPGVAPSSSRTATGGSASASTPLDDSGFTFGGLRARSNAISIDGLTNIDETTGSALVALSPEIVREFQVVNNGISAEFGGAAGGTINVITKTGANQFHGTAFSFIQNQRLNARNPFDGRRRLYHAYQPGFSLGGPLKKDKLFFYISAEQEHQIANDEPETDRAVRTAINSALAAGFAPRLTVRAFQTSIFRVGRDQTELAGKLTWVINSFNTANFRIAFTNNRDRGDAFNTATFNDASARGSVYSKDYQATGAVISVLKTTVVNEVRFQASRRSFTSRSGDQSGPGIDIVGVARFGRPYDADTNRRETREEAIDTLTITHGKHEWKTGGSLDHVSLTSSMNDGFGGLYVFRTLADFLALSPAMWRQTFGNSRAALNVTSFGAFVQDRWSITPKLTANLGLRYDVETLPGPFPTDKNNVSPRVGLAWSPVKGWAIRGGFGLFYDRLPLAYLNPAVQKDGINAFEQIAFDAPGSQVFVTNGGGRVGVPVASVAPSIYRGAPIFPTPHSIQASAGIERAIDKDTVVRAEFLFTRGIDLPRTRNINLAAPVVLTAANATALGFANPTPQQLGRLVFGPARLDPHYDAIYQLENSASSRYRGLSLAVNKRFGKEASALVSYTLSKTTDDASDFFEQPANPYDLAAERSRSLLDVRHRFVVSGVFDLPFGDEDNKAGTGARKDGLVTEILGNVEVAPILTFSSGRPVNALTGTDEERSGALPFAARPLGFARNSLTTPRSYNADLRIVKYIPFSKTAKLDFAFEFFNVFNNDNVVAINPYFGSSAQPLPTYRAPMALAAPRQFRFSLDLEF